MKRKLSILVAVVAAAACLAIPAAASANVVTSNGCTAWSDAYVYGAQGRMLAYGVEVRCNKSWSVGVVPTLWPSGSTVWAYQISGGGYGNYSNPWLGTYQAPAGQVPNARVFSFSAW